jgi:hypothetical protein
MPLNPPPLTQDFTLDRWLNLLWKEVSRSEITLATSIASTSGTSIDFTGLVNLKRIIISLSGVSTNNTSPIIIQIGDSGGVETSGYLGASSTVTTAVSTSNYTNGFGINFNNATDIIHGSIILTLVVSSTNTWAAIGNFSRSDSAGSVFSSGSKSLSAALDRVRITTSGGTAAFDAGTINIAYE